MAPTYSITPSLVAINEGQTLQTMFHVSGVARGTVLYWVIGGTSISTSDFSAGVLNGQFTVNPDASGAAMVTITNTLANDFTTEGSEIIQIRLFTNPARTLQVGNTANVTVNDTSRASATPVRTFSISTSVAAVNEGGVLTTTVSTTNVASGTLLYWALSGTGITLADFSAGALSGSGSVGANGQFSFSHPLANDLTTEGVETLQIKLYSDPARTLQVGNTANVTVNDTSLAPVPAPPVRTYKITPSATALNEGTLLTTTVSTSNVPTGTSLFWKISGNGITSTDFSSGTITGVGIIGSNGQFTLSHQLANDLTTEGNETLLISLYNDSALSVLLQSATVTVVDTSKASGPATYTLTPSTTSTDEGATLTMNVTTANVVDGTILYYQIRGNNIDSSDFSVGATMGQVLIRGGTASFKHVVSRDFKTEGDEVLLIRLFSDKPGGVAIGNQVQITVRDTSLAIPVATEVYQPKYTPFQIKKWATSVPVPTLKRPEIVGHQPDIWGTNFAPQLYPGGQPGLYQNLDPTQARYGGIAPEFYNQTVAGTNTPYYNTGQQTSWYSQREGARFQVVVDGANQVVSTEIFGYDSSFPGPTFKTRVGQPVVVRHWNDLPTVPGLPTGLVERESVHLHGAHNPAHSDGYPSFVINPGMYRDYYYANTVPMGNDGKPDYDESPSTMWYHDHGEDLTDLHVNKGMAGFWLTFDDIELNLVKNHILPGWWKSTLEWNEQEFMENVSPYGHLEKSTRHLIST